MYIFIYIHTHIYLSLYASVTWCMYGVCMRVLPAQSHKTHGVARRRLEARRPNIGTLQHTAPHCNTHAHTHICVLCLPFSTYQRHILDTSLSDTLQHTAPHCNTLHHTATCCNTHTHTHTYVCFPFASST